MLLTFVDPGCGPCNALLPDLARWQRELAGKVTLALVSGGSPEENRAKAQGLGIAQVLVQQITRSEQRLPGVRHAEHGAGAGGRHDRQSGRPGRGADSLAGGADAGHAARGRAGSSLAIPLVPAPVAVAPLTSGPALPELWQGTRTRRGRRGRPVARSGGARRCRSPTWMAGLLPSKATAGGTWWCCSGTRAVASASSCCPQLKQWEASHPPAAPALLVVSSGDAAANRALGLQSPLVLQESFQTGATFGANGTPSAVLVNQNG